MWNEKQAQLIDRVCALGGVKHSANSVRHTGALVVDGIAVSLLPGLTADALRIIVQLGEIPETLQLPVYRRMLELNLAIDRGNHQHLALDPETGTALLAYELRTDNAAAALTSLQRAVACATVWKQDYFLASPAPEAVA